MSRKNKPIGPIAEPRTRGEASDLARRSAHWTSGAINMNTGREVQPETRFRAEDRATLEAMLGRNGWTRRPDDEFGEHWMHRDERREDGTGVTWGFIRACQFTLHALAGKTKSSLFLYRIKITPLPEAA